jgi:signal transduction histidine kinase
MEPHTEVTMFRGLQELLAYTRDVSTATKVNIVLDVAASPIKAIVTFNGNDIHDTEAAAEQSQGKMFGLAPLRERVELVGGSLEIDNEAEGNRVEISLPTEQNA